MSRINGEERTDEQQVLLLGALRRAAGAPVSYADLRDTGIEFPAGVVAELELEGVPLERCRAGGGPGVRLDPARDRYGDDEPPLATEPPAAAPAPRSAPAPPPAAAPPAADPPVAVAPTAGADPSATADPPADADRRAPNPPAEDFGSREDEPVVTSGWSSIHVYRASPLGWFGRLLVPLLLVVAIAVVVVIVVVGAGRV